MIGALVQYPATDGAVRDFRSLCARAHAAGALVTAATDLLSLTLFVPPGEWGADIAVGNSQRFGVPMGYGGPHAAFFSTRDEYKRYLPGRIIGVSKDRDGRAGASHGAADAGAAHPPRQGDQQRVHRSGAARGDGEHVRGLSRARRAPPHRGAGARPGRDAGQRAPPASLPGGARLLLRHHLRRGAGMGAPPPARRRSHPYDQPAAPPAYPALHRARRDRDARRPGRHHRGVLAQRSAAVHAGGHRGSHRPRHPADAASAGPPTWRTRCSICTTPRPRCCGTSSGWKRATSRLRAP